MHEKRKKTLLYSTMAYVCVACIILNINLTQKENEAVKKQLRSLSFCVHAIQAVQRKKTLIPQHYNLTLFISS